MIEAPSIVGTELLAAGARCEAILVRSLALEAIATDPTLARATGHWKGEEACVETRCYRARGIAYARVARITAGPLAIVNLLCVPDATLALPLLGIDLVALGGRRCAMLAADLTPMHPDPAAHAAESEQVGALVGDSNAGLPAGGALPDWCVDWFSPNAMYVRPGEEALPRAVEALERFPRALVALVNDADARPSLAIAVRQRQRDYFFAHRTQDKGLGLLARMFGAAWTARYLDEILFPAQWMTM